MEITSLAQVWTGQFLRGGELAIDATIGNGHDTLFLAHCVGEQGIVLGFDIQETALKLTRRRLEEERMAERVKLFHRSHLEMEAALSDTGEERRPRAIMFNLGYLPGGDKRVTTRTDQTLPALDLALKLLEPGGGLTVALYPGHREGEREAAAVLDWAESLDRPFDATHCRLVNRSHRAPNLVLVEKRTDAGWTA